MKAYGIMGGTFDPVHYGHLLIAEMAREQLGLDRIIFIPAGQPAHKDNEGVTSAELRMQMTCCAIANNPWFECSRLEVDRSGESYAVDTISELRKQYPGETPYFITGTDTLKEVMSWHQAYRLPEITQFAVVVRPGYDFESVIMELDSDFQRCLHPVEAPHVHISSTDIRMRVKKGLSIRYMTPECVISFIEEHNLYR